MPKLRVHELDINYHHFGSASARGPVLCVPSTGLSGLQWRRLAKQLEGAGHEVFAVDLIGYGDSQDWHAPGRPADRGPFHTRYDVDVVDAVLDLCSAPVHLVAHSYGGRVGLQAGLRRPTRLRSLALFEPTCFGVLRSSDNIEGLAELLDYDADGRFLDDGFGGTPAWVERFVDYWSGAGSFAELDDDERARWLRSSRKMFEEVRETALDDISHDAYVDALGHLPCLLMSGALSTRAGRGCCEVLAKQLPHARHIELPDIGHMAPVLASREVASLIAAHIEAVEAGDRQARP